MDEMLQRARLVREVLVCLLLIGAIVVGIAVSMRVAETPKRDPRPAYCFAGDARANADECRR